MGHHTHREPNRWKGLVAGMLGGLVGLTAMRMYWKHAAPVVKRNWEIMAPKIERGAERVQQEAERQLPEATRALQPRQQQLHRLYDDISIPGRLYQEGESATAALGRMAYRRLTGHEPETQETKTVLSYLMHWLYGMLQGGVYGALRARAPGLDVSTGLTYSFLLWLVGDELVVPLLGLQSGPTAVSLVQHVNRLGAHLAFGTGTAVATQVFRRVL